MRYLFFFMSCPLPLRLSRGTRNIDHRADRRHRACDRAAERGSGALRARLHGQSPGPNLDPARSMWTAPARGGISWVRSRAAATVTATKTDGAAWHARRDGDARANRDAGTTDVHLSDSAEVAALIGSNSPIEACRSPISWRAAPLRDLLIRAVPAAPVVLIGGSAPSPRSSSRAQPR